MFVMGSVLVDRYLENDISKMTKTNLIGAGLDTISGVALLIFAGLIASGVMAASPAATHAMFALGGFELGFTVTLGLALGLNILLDKCQECRKPLQEKV